MYNWRVGSTAPQSPTSVARMIRSHRLLISLLVPCLAVVPAAPLRAQRCGVERWAIKTGTDAGAPQVDLAHPKAATIAQLVALTAPHPLPSSRAAPTENTVFVVTATLTDYKFEGGSTGDSDYHLVLQDDQGNTMIAEIPSPSCVGNNSPFAAQIASARAAFDAKLAAASSFHTANVPVRVTGVGMFDFPHGQHGAAPNEIELHPILEIVFNPTTAADFTLAASSDMVRVPQGGSTSLTITTAGASPVALSVSGLPIGASSHITPSGTGSSTIALTVGTGVLAGSYPFSVTGTAGSQSHSQIFDLEVTAASDASGTKVWEYQVINATSEQDVIDKANQAGAEGWEMVSVVKLSSAWRAFFKRVKPD